MTRPTAHDGAQGASQDGAQDGITDGPTVPMFDQATHLPGHARVAFSPLQFYTLSRVRRLDVDGSAEGLWLTEAPCPAVTEKGIAFFSRQFTHERIQPYITGLPNTPQRDLVIRYDRALLARGVLQEVILCERLAGGQVVERLRLRDRERVLAERDPNAALRERERFLAVYRAKITAAQEAQLTLAHGQAALERYRDEQAERRQRQRREQPAPMAAKPIRARSRSDAAAREKATKVHAIAEHLAGGTAVEAFDAPDTDHEAPGTGTASSGAPGPTPQPPADRPAAADQASRRSGGRGATGGRSKSRTVARGGAVPGDSGPPDAQAPTPSSPQDSQASTAPATGSDEASTASPDVPAFPVPASSLLEALGGRTGFLSLDDE